MRLHYAAPVRCVCNMPALPGAFALVLACSGVVRIRVSLMSLTLRH